MHEYNTSKEKDMSSASSSSSSSSSSSGEEDNNHNNHNNEGAEADGGVTQEGSEVSLSFDDRGAVLGTSSEQWILYIIQ